MATASTALTSGQAMSIVDATAFAVSLGRTPNLFITVTWRLVGAPGSSPDVTRDRMIEAISRWFKRRGEEAVYVAVAEWGAREGEHLHLMVSVAQPEEFMAFLREHLKARSDGAHEGLEHRRIWDLRGLVSYLLKDLEPGTLRRLVPIDVRELLGICWPFRAGPVTGRRYLVARALQSPTRGSAGYADSCSIDEAAERLAALPTRKPRKSGRTQGLGHDAPTLARACEPVITITKTTLFDELPEAIAPPRPFILPRSPRAPLVVKFGEQQMLPFDAPDVADVLGNVPGTDAEIATVLGLSRGHVTNLRNRRFGPSRQVARRVFELAQAA